MIEPTFIVLPDLLEGSFLHKTAATQADLGWIGKCALLITKEFGSVIRLGTVLTNAPLKPGIPVVTSSCGTYDKCQKVCPVQAPQGNYGVRVVSGITSGIAKPVITTVRL